MTFDIESLSEVKNDACNLQGDNTLPPMVRKIFFDLALCRAYTFCELAACGGSQKRKRGFCEDTSRSGKGLPPSALLLSARTHKPYYSLYKEEHQQSSYLFRPIRVFLTGGGKGPSQLLKSKAKEASCDFCAKIAACLLCFTF